jgi:hypothetical protein
LEVTLRFDPVVWQRAADPECTLPAAPRQERWAVERGVEDRVIDANVVVDLPENVLLTSVRQREVDLRTTVEADPKRGVLVQCQHGFG